MGGHGLGGHDTWVRALPISSHPRDRGTGQALKKVGEGRVRRGGRGKESRWALGKRKRGRRRRKIEDLPGLANPLGEAGQALKEELNVHPNKGNDPSEDCRAPGPQPKRPLFKPQP